VITPAGRLSTSQGNRWATTMGAMSSGFLVTAEASQG
jgi:hypothetical protein